MQITDLSETKKEIKVNVERDVIEKERKEVTAKVRSEASIPGFRKGCVPLNLVKQKFKDTIESRLLKALLSESVYNIVREKKWDCVDAPRIKDAVFRDDGSLEYTATVEIFSNIELKESFKLSLEKKAFPVTDEEINGTLINLQKRWAEYVPIKDRSIKMDDIVLFDFEAFHNDKPVKNGQARGHIIRIGEKKFFQEVEEKLIGCNINDKKDVSAKFPEDHPDKELAGQDVIFKIEIKNIMEEKLPDINDDFAAKMGKFKNLDELKNNIKEELEKTKAKMEELNLKEEARKSLAKEYPFEPPESLVEKRLAEISRDVEMDFRSRGIKFEGTDDDIKKIRERYLEDAKNSVKASIILQKIAGKEKIEASIDEVEAEIRKISEVWKKPINETAKILEKRNLLPLLEDGIKESKALDFVIAKAEIKEVNENTI